MRGKNVIKDITGSADKLEYEWQVTVAINLLKMMSGTSPIFKKRPLNNFVDKDHGMQLTPKFWVRSNYTILKFLKLFCKFEVFSNKMLLMEESKP